MAEQIIQLAKNVLKRVVCLYRVSTVGQVEKDDIPMQKQFCREFVQRQPGWEIVKEFSEKGVSGFKVSAKKRDAVQEIQRIFCWYSCLTAWAERTMKLPLWWSGS